MNLAIESTAYNFNLKVLNEYLKSHDYSRSMGNHRSNLKYYLSSILYERQGVGSSKLADIYDELIKSPSIPSGDSLKKHRDYLDRLGVGVVAFYEDRYPELLREIPYPPFLLYYYGDLGLICTELELITLVGSRGVTRWSDSFLQKSICTIERADIVTVSGLAYGVDSCVHRYSLDSSVPTIAVVAGGIDAGYPRGNETLYRDIVKDGLVLSEFPPGRPVIKGMFPLRNRIMAGLSRKSVVIQAASRSGSLITANYAADYGRDVYSVIPDDKNDPRYRGNLELIESGAIPIVGLNTALEDKLG